MTYGLDKFYPCTGFNDVSATLVFSREARPGYFDIDIYKIEEVLYFEKKYYFCICF
jgi:hypothetical protein